ncbi:hypothetical protein HY967_02080 [Candidatus Jorgensenbacteria bacterium]|nr:hypothetical protein [Candidatus Jorgensenbacteria bacterium]
MNKTNKILLVLVIVLFVVLIGFVGWREWFVKSNSYYAVYLRTGDIYFGQLVRFPYFGLKQVYLLQVNRDNQQNPLSIQKFTRVFWEPEDYLKINRNEVVWMAKLQEGSQLAKVIETNPDLLPPPQLSDTNVPQINSEPQPK